MKDPAGNIKLQKTKHRDDAAAAAILAVAEGTRRHGLMSQAMKRPTVVVAVAFNGIMGVWHTTRDPSTSVNFAVGQGVGAYEAVSPGPRQLAMPSVREIRE